jgi:predicted ABC-type ATPase
VPSFTVVAGPNGSGKTTLTRYGREAFQQLAVLDPDAVARGMTNAGEHEASAIDAGRQVLKLAGEFLERGESFLVETTLSGNTYTRMMLTAKARGFNVVFIFVGTETVEINLQRVKDRVRKGGHDVPEEDQRRRYDRSFRHMREAFLIADRAVLYDNSTSSGHRKVAVKRATRITLYQPLPAWAEFLRKEM